MKRFVNGDEIELVDTGAEIIQGHDRLYVKTADGTFTAAIARIKGELVISYRGNQYRIQQKQSRPRSTVAQDSGELRAHMPGQIVDVRASVGESVTRGTTILVLEAMKTQQPFVAPFDGVVAEIRVAKGDQVTDGAILAVVSPVEVKHE